MTGTSIALPDAIFRSLSEHLLPRGGKCEEAAFVFAHSDCSDGCLSFTLRDWLPITPDGFECRSPYFLELSDATRAMIIKRAHDLGASVIEFHSHPQQRRACFSWSDLHGFDEFVPHIMWRLKGRPYAAVVFAPGSVDALAWTNAGEPAVGVAGISTEAELIRPTGLTLAQWSDIYDRSPL